MASNGSDVCVRYCALVTHSRSSARRRSCTFLRVNARNGIPSDAGPCFAESVGSFPFHTAMKPLVVVEFVALLLLGPHVATLVAMANAVIAWFTDRDTARSAARLAGDAVTAVVAIQAAGFVYQALGATPGDVASEPRS